MRHLKWICFLIQIAPFRSAWSAGVRHHVEQCQRCQAGLGGIEEARMATVAEDKMGKRRDFWAAFMDGLEKDRSVESLGRRLGRRWTLAAAGFAVATAAVGLFLLHPATRNDPASAVKLRISYVTMYEKPAQAIFFQTQDGDMTFVWVEKQNSGETL